MLITQSVIDTRPGSCGAQEEVHYSVITTWHRERFWDYARRYGWIMVWWEDPQTRMKCLDSDVPSLRFVMSVQYCIHVCNSSTLKSWSGDLE